MNYDKVSYLFWCIIVLFLIFGVSIFSKYGKNIINDATFRMFFSWYVGLFIVNLFNILLNLIYHYFMKDLQGPRGLKGEVGDKGLSGQDEKCGCDIPNDTPTGSDSFDIDDADKIVTKTVYIEDENSNVPAPSVDFKIDNPDYNGRTGSIMLSKKT